MFDAYVTSIFLYNSELWTLTKSKEKENRCLPKNLVEKDPKYKLAQKYIKQKTPGTNKTRKLVMQNKCEKTMLVWTCMQTKRAYTAQVALKCIQTNQKMKKLRGGQKTTWLKQLENDVKQLDVDPKEAQELAKDRST